MLTSGLDSRLELALLLPVLVDGDALSLVHIPSEIRHARPPGGWESGGCGAWIRTKDLRVMSPTSCRCSTPRFELYPGLFHAPSQGIPHLLRKAGLWIASERTLLHKSGRIFSGAASLRGRARGRMRRRGLRRR